MPANDRGVAGPRVQMSERNHEHERAREVGVVRRVRVDVEERQRSLSDLIRNATGLFVAPRVDAIALQSPEPGEARLERLSTVHPRRLPSGGQRVPAEQRRIQGHAGLQREPFVALALEQRE